MKKIILCFFFLFLLVSCQSAASPTPLSETPTLESISPTRTARESIPKPTRTLTPTITTTPTLTSTPTSIYPTPTFNTRDLQTVTPSTPQKCPQKNYNLSPDIRDILIHEHFYRLGDAVFGFLNSGGTFPQLIKPITVFSEFWQSEETYVAKASQQDLTGDGTPEILFRDWGNFYIFGCRDGQYQIILEVETNEGTFYHTGASVYAVQDINLDGLPEVILIQGSCGNCVDNDYRVLEWNGSSFVSLLGNEGYRSAYGNIHSGFVYPEVLTVAGYPFPDASIHPPIIQDPDQNGVKDLVFMGGIPSSFNSRYHLPWRVETITLSWNGSAYAVSDWKPDPPVYRFQSVQDGDVYSLKKEFDLALASYQEAIFSDTLDFWSPERLEYEREMLMYDPSISTTPAPTKPEPDPAEYPNLAAYARYRIMLLHLVQGHLADAEIVYKTLIDKFPEGSPGSQYASLARLFWNEYQLSHDIAAGCRVVVEKVTKDPAVYVNSLGNRQGKDLTHGWWSLDYTPNMVCPIYKN